jgi:hypothetical protein
VLEKATQCLQSLVGRTQSNISIHLYIHSIRSSGVQTHIKYLGFSFANTGSITSRVLYISSLLSQTESPQIATQGQSSFEINSADCFLKSS